MTLGGEVLMLLREFEELTKLLSGSVIQIDATKVSQSLDIFKEIRDLINIT